MSEGPSKRVELPPELWERLQAAASEHQRSVAAETRFALGLYLTQLDRRHAATGG